MDLDQQSLKDLEVFQTQNSGTSVFDLFNRTVTRDGKIRLEKRFRAPFSTPSDIRAEQDIIRFFLRFPSFDFFLVTEKDLSHLEEYLQSNFKTFQAATGWIGFLQNRHFEYTNHAFTQFVRVGVPSTLAVLRKVRGIFSVIRGESAIPEKIQQFCRNVEQLERDLALENRENEITASGGDFEQILRLDCAFRRDFKENMCLLVENLGELDCYLAMARTTRDFRFPFPEILDSPETVLEIEDVFHPFVPSPRLNSFSNRDGKSIFLLTGPNMAGKTTFLKACTLAVIMAQMGMGVPARRMTLTPFTRIFCTLSAADDIREGISSFGAEIRRVKKVLENIIPGNRVLAIFDELFKGTNVIDALECSSAVIHGFSQFRRHLFFISSHLLELAEKVGLCKEVAFSCFDAEICEGKMRFDYALKAGVNRKRFGFHILVQEGIQRLIEEKKKAQD